MDGDGRRRRAGRRRGGRDHRRRRRGRRRHQRRRRRSRAPRRSSTRRSSASGALDVLINNAGIIRWAGFPEADEDNLARHLAVHTVGSFNTARAAWPHMVEQGYGRIVMTTSSGIFGLPEQHLVRHGQGRASSASPAAWPPPGAAHGIRVNLIAPAAMTRMAGGGGAPRPWRPSSWRRWRPSWRTSPAR